MKWEKLKGKNNLREASKPVMKFGQGTYAVAPAGVLGQQDHPSKVNRQYGPGGGVEFIASSCKHSCSLSIIIRWISSSGSVLPAVAFAGIVCNVVAGHLNIR